MAGVRNTLLVIPTYNEAGNIERLLREIQEQGVGLDLLVIDDHSPDGTGALLETLAARMPLLRVIHREAKLGIGSAHKQGFAYAIEHGYTRVITMDADFSHDPSYLGAVLEHARSADVVLGSRYLKGGGLRGWSVTRRVITHTAHWLTTCVLRLPYDCTGGFRLYRVSVLRRIDWQGIRSDGYAFLIEMLYRAQRLGCSIHEIPIVISSRHSGRSKISHVEILRAVTTLVRLSLQGVMEKRPVGSAGPAAPAMDWDQYWTRAGDTRHGVYEIIAEFYRRQIISRMAAHVLRRHLPDEVGRHYLHAGCGSGGADQRWQLARAVVHALDRSVIALGLNRSRGLPFTQRHVCGDLFRLPYRSQAMDGIFNFGVMEHFHVPEIEQILVEFRRVLKPGGRLVLFWPPNFGLSVIALAAFVKFVNLFRQVPLKLHPDEVARIPSFSWLRALMQRKHFRVTRILFGWRDLFTYVVVVAELDGIPMRADGPSLHDAEGAGVPLERATAATAQPAAEERAGVSSS